MSQKVSKYIEKHSKYLPGELGGELLRGISISRIWFDSVTTCESKLFSCRVTVEPDCSLVRHGRSTTSELGLSAQPLGDSARPRL